MPEIEALVRKKLSRVVLVQVMALVLGLAFQLDLALNSKTTGGPSWFIVGPGLVIGAILGIISSRFLPGKLSRLGFRLVFPFWVGMAMLAFTLGGLVCWLRAEVPMNWRPVVTAALLSSIFGCLGGGLVSRRLSQDLMALEPLTRISDTFKTLYADERRLLNDYPGAVFEVRKQSKDTFICSVSVPRDHQTAVFYIVCKEGYPNLPPGAVRLELENQGRSVEVAYDAPILYRWNNTCNLRDVVQEAIDLLRL